MRPCRMCHHLTLERRRALPAWLPDWLVRRPLFAFFDGLDFGVCAPCVPKIRAWVAESGRCLTEPLQDFPAQWDAARRAWRWLST